MAACPEVSFDPTAPLPAEFGGEYLPEDYTRRVATDFLDALAALYANPDGVDRCRWFTDAGWASALRVDWRLHDVVAGVVRLRQEHVLRAAFESVNEPAGVPPRLAFDLVFDIPPGSAVIDARSGQVRERWSEVRRTGLHYAFVFDGEDWRVDTVGDLSSDDVAWAKLPTDPPAGPPCRNFTADAAPGATFDDAPDRTWCDGDGRGTMLAPGTHLGWTTRYPCDNGHAVILGVGRPLGSALDPLLRWEYVRDPAAEFVLRDWVRSAYDGEAILPPGAAYTGWTNGNVELWIEPDELDDAVYMVRGAVVERWPRAADQWGVIDCN